MFEGIKSVISGIKTSLIGPITAQAAQKTTETTNKSAENQKVENELVEAKFDNGQLVKNNKIWTGGEYIYTANGKETYGEIKEALGLEDGVLRKNNSSIFEYMEGNADEVKPKEGTQLKLYETDLPSKPAEFTDDEGNPLEGFRTSYSGKLFYVIQPGDNQTSIQEKFKNECFKYYKTDDAMEGFHKDLIFEGHEVRLPEKGPIGKFFAWLGIY